MTEIQYLLSLLMGDYKVSPALKKSLLARIGEVEEGLRQAPIPNVRIIPQHQAPVPLESVAHTAAAAEALAQRQKSISQAMSNVPEAGRQSPRKF